MKKYNIIYADPPWSFGSKAYQDGNRKMLNLDKTQYQTLSIEEIKSLPINEITKDDSALFLWTTDAHLKEAIEVIESWGFIYKTIAFVWVKKYESGSNVYNFEEDIIKQKEKEGEGK